VIRKRSPGCPASVSSSLVFVSAAFRTAKLIADSVNRFLISAPHERSGTVKDIMGHQWGIINGTTEADTTGRYGTVFCQDSAGYNGKNPRFSGTLKD
jgi:hypothetical protein